MAKLASIATDFVRKIFARERQNSELAISTKELARAQTRNSLGYGTGFDLTGNGGIGDVLGNDRRLLHRYADYEEMDEYGDIASCLDIYSDDATQTDSETDHTLWVESKDQAVRDDLTDVFQKRIKTDENAWEMMRTLCKYGNDFEEIVIGENGVVGLNYLPPATCRRVDSDRGDFLGVVQSFSSDLEINAKQFEAMKTKTGAMVNPDGNMAAFEDWRVAHMRLRSKNRESMYGWCLVGESRVWTQSGPKFIKDVSVGDFVYTRHSGFLRLTKVIDHVCSGEKPIFNVRTKHREIRATAEHPLLVSLGKKNNKWTKVSDLEVGDKIVVCSKSPQTISNVPLGVRLKELRDDTICVLTERGSRCIEGKAGNLKHGKADDGVCHAFFGEDITRSKQEELRNGKSGLPFGKWREIFSALDVPFFEGAVTVKVNENLTVPDFVEPWFMRFLGFMIGDGWISNGRVNFALSDKEAVDKRYMDMLGRFGLPVSEERYEGRKGGYAYVSSCDLDCLFRMIGWIDGAHEKRIMPWVYGLDEESREAFLDGLMDADGWTTREGSYKHIELCNKNLVLDIKTLVDGLGWISGNVRRRGPRISVVKRDDGSTEEISSKEQFLLFFRRAPLSDGDFGVESIVSITPDGSESVYDIGVEDGGHNFVADGIVVHNSIAEPARWIWRRLMLLEDAVLVYKLSRSPSRYAFYVDVGNLPRQEAERVIEQVKNKVKKKKFVNPRTGKLDLKFNPLSFDEDFFLAMRDGQEKTRIDVLNGPSYQQVEDVQYFLSKLYAALKVPRAYLGYDENMPSKATLCLAGDTKILLLDGTSPTIEELARKNESFWVYSIDENKNVVPGLASAPRLTRTKAPTVRVELDNGEVITCTPDHPIMNRFGVYVSASELMPGDSLMPLHRRMSSGKVDGYEEVYDPGDNRWRYTHNMVNDALFRGEEAEMVCHHKNFDRRDNRPANLAFVSLDEHRHIQSVNVDEELAWSDVRVVSVKHGEIMDTFDLTVDDYHNFAIGQGVFVHNSQEDVRFARTVLRIQSEFINGMRKIARVHLATRRIDPVAVDFQIKMAVPSAIFELGQMEVRRSRADLASQMERHVSSYFLLSNIYGLSDDEIADITKQKKEEQKSMGGGMGGGFESVDRKGDILTSSGISDRELFKGNREHEKAIEEMLHKEIEKANTPLGKQMRETLALVREIASATKGVNW